MANTKSGITQYGPKVIVALDFPGYDAAMMVASRLDPAKCRVKVGKELYTAEGPRMVEALKSAGFDVFLDLKFHDIPNTVASAVRAACGLGVWMLNFHALGGRAMMEVAREAVEAESHRPKLVAVTVLTSHTSKSLEEILGFEFIPEMLAFRLAKLAHSCGMDGVVCSARESRSIRQECGSGFLLVTPGIRPAGADANDQERIATPAGAILQGSDYEVIGRPITKAADPIAALDAINREINEAIHAQS